MTKFFGCLLREPCDSVIDCERDLPDLRMQAVRGTFLARVRIPLETNESKTALELVKGLILHGKLIVGDAAYRRFTQSAIGSDPLSRIRIS